VSALRRFELEVVHWEGSFGSYVHPAPGGRVVVDLAAVGSPGVIGIPLEEADRLATFDLAHLRPVSDEVEGPGDYGWFRRVVLAGRRAGATEKTVLELTIQYEVERTTKIDGRRVRQRSNVTHYGLRLHTLREDDTIREYGRARATVDRDAASGDAGR